MSEIFERLLEIEQTKLGEAKVFIRRLATLADTSERAFVMVLRFGSGDTGALLRSYEEQVAKRGVTRQCAHWQWQEDIRAVKYTFPEIAALLSEYRETVKHREDGMSAADGLRAAMDRTEGSE
jgi:hypothetical protein